MKYPDGFHLIVGCMGQGKTTLVHRCLLTNYKHGRVKRVVIFTSTSVTSFRYIPKKFIHKYSDEKLETLITSLKDKGRLKSALLKQLGHQEDVQGKDLVEPTVVIVDDNMGILIRSSVFTHFVTIIRHINCSVYYLTQMVTCIPTVTRRVLSYLYIFMPTENELYEIHKQFFRGKYRTLREMKNELNIKLVSDHHFMFLDVFNRKNKYNYEAFTVDYKKLRGEIKEISMNLLDDIVYPVKKSVKRRRKKF